MKLHLYLRTTLACLLIAPLAMAAPPPTPTPVPATGTPAPAAKGPVTAEQMDRVKFDGLSAEQKKTAETLLNQGSCDCGCGMKAAECIVKDAKCNRSKELGDQVVDLLKKGKSKDEVYKAVLTPPTKFVQFPFEAGDSPAVGPKNAKVTLLHYFDFQCPFCQKVLASLDEVQKTYPNDVRIVYKMHPLDIHPNAMPAAEAAMAANAQGKYFEMSKKLFENQSQLTRDNFLKWAKEIGLDVDKFTKDIDGNKYADRINKEAKEMEGIGATGTPATFVNGRYVSGAKQFAFFKDMIDEELGWAKAGNRPEFKTGKNVSETVAKSAAPSGPDPNKVYDLAVKDAASVGPKSAKVTLVHFFDYQCPFCVRVHPTLEQLLKDYPNDLRIVYAMHPLPMHQNAMPAAEAAMAAHAQGKFAAMSQKLYENTTALSRDKYIELAKDLGLDVDKFTKDIDANAYKTSIDAQASEAMKIGATGTPASFINGRYLSGAQPVEAFKKIIDEEIAKNK